MIGVYVLASCLLVSVYLWVCWCVVCCYNVLWICSVVICKSYHVPVSVCTGVLVRFGWSRVVSGCRLERYWFVCVGWSGRGLMASWNNGLVSPHSVTNKTLMHKHLSLQSSIPTDSHQLLRMNVIAFETCCAIKNFHKVTSSWFSLFN